VIFRENWQSGEANQQRGRDWLATIYRHNDTKTAELMAAHKDFSTSSSTSFLYFRLQHEQDRFSRC